MLQKFREKFAGTFAIVLLALLAVSFVFFGLNYSFIGSQWAARVDGEEINAVEFENAYRNALQRNPDLAALEGPIRMQVRRNLLDQLVAEQLIDNFLNERGYRISDEQLVESIRDIAEFQNEEGVFDRDVYRAFLAERGFDPAQFERLQRNTLRQQQLQLAVTATALVTPAEYRRYLNLVAEQRVVTLARIDAEAVTDEIEITDEMVTAYYENNPTLFTVPESADVEYIEISRAAVADGIEVSEEDLEAYYEENRSLYLQDEQRRARHILILAGDDPDAAEARALDILQRVRAGESFEALAAELSEDTLTATQGGDFGSLTRAQYPDELAGPIFAMEEGEIEGPLESEFGFHIVRLDEILERGPLPLDEVRGELLTELRRVEAEDRFDELERTMSDALFDNPNMQAIAEATGQPVKTATGITREGGDPFGQNQAAIDAIFDDLVLKDGRISEVTELDADRVALFKVVEYRPEQSRPLDEVRDEVVAALTAEEAERLLAERAGQVLAAVDAGEPFADAAEAAGFSVEEPRSLERTTQDVDQSLVFEVFAAPKPAEDDPVTGRVQLLDGGYVVYKLEAVLPGRPEAIPLPERDRGKLQLAQQSGFGDFQAFVQALHEEADIVVNDDVLAADDLFQ